MLHDSEEAQARALLAIEALTTLFESVPPGCEVPSQHVAALFGLAGDAMRQAMPQRSLLYGVND